MSLSASCAARAGWRRGAQAAPGAPLASPWDREPGQCDTEFQHGFEISWTLPRVSGNRKVRRRHGPRSFDKRRHPVEECRRELANRTAIARQPLEQVQK
jgi:hypothetical protein